MFRNHSGSDRVTLERKERWEKRRAAGVTPKRRVILLSFEGQSLSPLVSLVWMNSLVDKDYHRRIQLHSSVFTLLPPSPSTIDELSPNADSLITAFEVFQRVQPRTSHNCRCCRCATTRIGHHLHHCATSSRLPCSINSLCPSWQRHYKSATSQGLAICSVNLNRLIHLSSWLWLSCCRYRATVASHHQSLRWLHILLGVLFNDVFVCRVFWLWCSRI